MTAKEFLLQYGNTKAEIETLLDQIIAQRELAEKITVSFDNDGGASCTRKTDKLESCVEKIIDLEDEIIRRSGELADIRKSVYNTITAVQDSKLRTLLIMHYIGGKPFRVIAETMHNSNGESYNEHHVAHRMHDKALSEVKKILDNQ